MLTHGLYGLDVPMQAIVGTGVEVHNAQSLSRHDPSSMASAWTTIGSFQVDSASSTGFEMTAQLAGAGWSHYGTGSTQDTDYNKFNQFRLNSSESANYEGSNNMNTMLPNWGTTVDTSVQTFSNGTQSQAMTNWEVEIHAKWGSSATLLEGAYTQVLTLTIATN